MPAPLNRAPRCSGRIACLGTVAAKALQVSSAGRVAAVFERSLYVELDGAWLCFGPTALGPGPLNVNCVPHNGLDWQHLNVRLESAVHATPTQIRIGSALALSRSDATLWTPPATPEPWNTATLTGGLTDLYEIMRSKAPHEGLGALALPDISPQQRTALVGATREPVNAISDALPELLAGGAAPERLVAAMRCLIGLGPGLTPSGDDVLGGLLLTLHLLDRAAMGRRLFARLRAQFESDSNPISVAHVSAAAAGAGSAALHQTVNAVMAGDRRGIADGLQRLDHLGHTSGWDSLAGAVLVLRAYSAFARDMDLTRRAVTQSAGTGQS